MAKECSNSSCNKSSCEGCGQKQPQSLMAEPNVFSDVKHVIGVVSGKGGVGKSFVTGSLANMMAAQGYKVGILDADITGPSIPKMYGVHGSAVGSEAGMFPCVAKDGTKIRSVNLLLEHESDPVIWRGPVIAGVVTQFWTDVMWGDLDFLFVDMPPGTGDVPLTVFLGLVENYSYLECPDCGKKISVFGESHIDEIAEKLGVEVLGKMPIDPKLAEIVEQEKFYEADNQYLKNIIDKFN